MKLMTTRSMIQGVAQAWRFQYERFKCGADKMEIADKLDALDKDTATSEDVARIIGNDSWTKLRCDECARYVEAVVQVGEEPEIESHTACLCRECFDNANALWPNPSGQLPADRKETP